MECDWDEAKNLSNRHKHLLSFAEAKELFESGVNYLEVFDEDLSENEDRFIAVGPIAGGLVVVVYTEPAEGVVRIISARPATAREQELYREHMDRYK